MWQIGRGYLSISRNELGGSDLVGGIYHDNKVVGVPEVTGLFIDGHAGFVTEAGDFSKHFAFLSYELHANFVNMDFAGNLQMGFTEEIVEDYQAAFKFVAAPFPSSFAPEVTFVLYFIQPATGQEYTATHTMAMQPLSFNPYGINIETRHQVQPFPLLVPEGIF